MRVHHYRAKSAGVQVEFRPPAASRGLSTMSLRFGARKHGMSIGSNNSYVSIEDGDDATMRASGNSAISRMSFIGSIHMDDSKLWEELEKDDMVQKSINNELLDLKEVPEDDDLLVRQVSLSFQKSVQLEDPEARDKHSSLPKFKPKNSFAMSTSSSIKSSISSLGIDLDELESDLFPGDKPSRAIVDTLDIDFSAFERSPPEQTKPGVKEVVSSMTATSSINPPARAVPNPNPAAEIIPRPPDVVLEEAVSSFDPVAYQRRQQDQFRQALRDRKAILEREEIEVQRMRQQLYAERMGKSFLQDQGLKKPAQPTTTDAEKEIQAAQERLNRLMERTEGSRLQYNHQGEPR